MRGEPCGLHPARIMKGKRPPCGRLDSQVEVEDHGNGFMFVGTTDINQARRILSEYVDDPEEFAYAARTWYEGRAHGVWLSKDPLAAWEGATHYDGVTPLPR